jgi:hypothetical protein
MIPGDGREDLFARCCQAFDRAQKAWLSGNREEFEQARREHEAYAEMHRSGGTLQ